MYMKVQVQHNFSLNRKKNISFIKATLIFVFYHILKQIKKNNKVSP